MNRKWCTAEFWTESLKWLVFRLSSACIRSARLAQLCRVTTDWYPFPSVNHFLGNLLLSLPGSSSALCSHLSIPEGCVCFTLKSSAFFPPWAKVNRGIIFCLEVNRTSRKWLRSLHSFCPSSSPQPISWEHNRGSGGHWSPSLSI